MTIVKSVTPLMASTDPIHVADVLAIRLNANGIDAIFRCRNSEPEKLDTVLPRDVAGL